jgi:hypothetical protein
MMAGPRCLPRRRPRRPARAAVPLVRSAAAAAVTLPAQPSLAGFVQPAIDTLAATGYRPPWLSRELLAVLEARGRLLGTVYLLHFDRPIGDVANPRGFASHSNTGRLTCRPGWSSTPLAAAPA